MVDVSEKMVGKTAKELLGFGARAYATSNYDAAVQFLSRATELTVAEEGSHTHDSLGEVYFLYGKSLLELSREEGDPLGDVVPKDVAFEQEAEEEEEGKDAEGKDAEGKDAEGDVGSGDDGSEESDDEEDVEDEEGDEDGNDSEGVAGEKGDGEVSEQDNKTNEEEKKVGSIKITSNGVEFNGEIEKSEAIENLENDDKYKSLDNLEKIGQFGRRGDLTKAGTSGDKSDEEEPASDLQVAWEVLELAKIIFTKRGAAARSDLAETLIALGEVSLESESFESAVNDIREGLEIQKILYDDTDRALAETHYKLGMALSMNNKMDEAIENFNRSIQLLKNRIDKLNEGEKDIDKKEVDEMMQLIPEIEEKIVDMRNYNEEVAKKVNKEPRPILPGSPDKKATDISHLVKRKRKSLEGDEASGNLPKKPALNL